MNVTCNISPLNDITLYKRNSCVRGFAAVVNFHFLYNAVMFNDVASRALSTSDHRKFENGFDVNSQEPSEWRNKYRIEIMICQYFGCTKLESN